MLVGLYRTKAELQRAIGEPLHCEPDNLLMSEYRPFGTMAVRGANLSPEPTWYAEVTLIDGRIVRVE